MKTNYKNICLIGFMGVGKTSVGQSLAEKLDMKFYDTDTLIEEKLGMEIPAIFEKKGEAYFRKIEEETACKILEGEDVVISLGGGSFLNKEVQKSAEKSFVVCLSMKLNTFLKKVEEFRSTRPILKDKSLDDIEDLYNIRAACYRNCDLDILVDKLSVEQISQKIIQAVKE